MGRGKKIPAHETGDSVSEEIVLVQSARVDVASGKTTPNTNSLHHSLHLKFFFRDFFAARF